MTTSVSEKRATQFDARQLMRWALRAGMLLLVIWLLVKAWRIGRHTMNLLSLRGQVTEIISGGGGLAALDPAELEQIVFTARRDVDVLATEARPFARAGQLLSWVPRYGPLFRAGPALLETADYGSSAATYLVYGLKPGLDLLTDENVSQSGRLNGLMQVLQNAGPFLEQASRDIGLAAEAYASIGDPSQLPGPLSNLLTPIDTLLPVGPAGLELAQMLPDMMGMNGPRNYLILAQNADELRATGGFISGVGILRVDQGEIVELTFSDSYAIDDYQNKEYEFPPQPYYDFMGLDLWLFRDANWWPDFPRSAEKALTLYQYSVDEAPELDGVIAIDQYFTEALVAAVGPLDVPDLGERVNGRNVISKMHEAWGPAEGQTNTAEWFADRKSFMGSLVQAVQLRVLQEPTSFDATLLLQAIVNSAEERHLQIYLRDPEAAAVVAGLGWDGSQHVPEGEDYLFVVDTNMGYNKVNFVLDRALTYQVTLPDEGAPQASLDLTYTHTGPVTANPCVHVASYAGNIQYADLLDDCYWNFLRLYTPRGVTLLEASQHPVSADFFWMQRAWEGEASVSTTDAYTLIENFLLVERDSTVVSSYRYTLPPAVVQQTENGNSRYTLTLVKQAGARPQTVRVAITLPPNGDLVSATPQPIAITDGIVAFEFELERDQTITLTYR